MALSLFMDICNWDQLSLSLSCMNLVKAIDVRTSLKASCANSIGKLFNYANFSNLKLGLPLAVNGVFILLGLSAYNALAKLNVSPLLFLVM